MPVYLIELLCHERYELLLLNEKMYLTSKVGNTHRLIL